jgi:pseudouridylate synthase
MDAMTNAPKNSGLPPFIDIAPDVETALAKGQPVVALESTIITHGMPWPQNAAMAANVEGIIRREGATPATIAVMGGRLKIGLGATELQALAQTQNAMKASRADLAYALSTGADAGTTVAATMMAAHLACIRVFATGGIGGVHIGAEQSFDVSADLDELARTPVIVVWKCLKQKAFRLSVMAPVSCLPSGRATVSGKRPCGWMTPLRSPGSSASA